MNKVFVVQVDPEMPKNLSSAKEFGELVFCLERPIKLSDIDLAESHLLNKMDSIGPNDWILPIGAPALIAIAGAIMMAKTNTVRVLAWDRKNQSYYPYEAQNE